LPAFERLRKAGSGQRRRADRSAIRRANHASQKKLAWIEGTTRRFDGYDYFGEHPESPIDWFGAHAG
jgi:hypothetical protein